MSEPQIKTPETTPTPILILSLFGFALCVVMGFASIILILSEGLGPSPKEPMINLVRLILGVIGFIGLWGMKRWGAYLYTIASVPTIYGLASDHKGFVGFAISISLVILVWAYFHKMK